MFSVLTVTDVHLNRHGARCSGSLRHMRACGHSSAIPYGRLGLLEVAVIHGDVHRGPSIRPLRPEPISVHG
jgi:hypothetical protein